MSILIKGMKMPKNCLECELGYIETETYCMALHEYIEVDDSYRYRKCPLVEVPEPHGDLIDRDSLIRARLSKEFYGNNLASLEWDNKCIYSAPAVIEAEEQEHETIK